MSKVSSFYCEYECRLVIIVVSEHNISKSSYVSFSLLVWAKQGILSKNYPKIGKMSFLHYRLDIQPVFAQNMSNPPQQTITAQKNLYKVQSQTL